MKISYIAIATLILFTSNAFAERVKVEEQIAITKPYTKKVKVGEKCYETTIEEIVPCQGNEETNSIGLDTIIGATIGVVIGNQIGEGNGKAAAKVIGGLTGGYLANQDRNNQKCKQYRKITKCDPVYEYRTEEVVVGYENCANYNGQRICKKTKEPLDYLEVTQTIIVH
jgi:uncharacterized protein YcfJ